MADRPLLLLVEGLDDGAIVRSLFDAAQYPQDRVHVMGMGGKEHIRNALKSLPPEEASHYAVLVDLDETGAADAAEPDDRELLRPLFVDVFAHIRGASGSGEALEEDERLAKLRVHLGGALDAEVERPRKVTLGR